MAKKKSTVDDTTPAPDKSKSATTEVKATKTTSAKSTVKKKTVAKKKAAVGKTAAGKKTVTASRKAPQKRTVGSNVDKSMITPEQRHTLICETAYYLSLQHNGCSECSSINDWLQAEKIVDDKYRVAAH